MKISTLIKKIILLTKKNKPIISTEKECIIFGSGPSLDSLNGESSFLIGKDLIGCNFMHRHKSLEGKKFKIFSMIDRDYTKKVNKTYFQTLDCEHFLVSTKNVYLFDFWCLSQNFINVIPVKTFTPKADEKAIVSGKELLTGNSLPFLIQCAAFLAGYKTIYLYGVDHFSPDSLEDNQEHNFNDYHGRKIKQLTMTQEKLSYINAFYDFVSQICERQSVTVLNVTPDSKLDAFKKIKIDGLVKFPGDSQQTGI